MELLGYLDQLSFNLKSSSESEEEHQIMSRYFSSHLSDNDLSYTNDTEADFTKSNVPVSTSASVHDDSYSYANTFDVDTSINKAPELHGADYASHQFFQLQPQPQPQPQLQLSQQHHKLQSNPYLLSQTNFAAILHQQPNQHAREQPRRPSFDVRVTPQTQNKQYHHPHHHPQQSPLHHTHPAYSPFQQPNAPSHASPQSTPIMPGQQLGQFNLQPSATNIVSPLSTQSTPLQHYQSTPLQQQAAPSMSLLEILASAPATEVTGSPQATARTALYPQVGLQEYPDITTMVNLNQGMVAPMVDAEFVDFRVCSVCSKHITRDMSRHMRTHLIIPRFQCAFPKLQCSHKSGRFNRPYDFKKHLLNKHFKFDNPEIKRVHNLSDKLNFPGSCICGLRAMAKDWLDNHVLTNDSTKRCPCIEP